MGLQLGLLALSPEVCAHEDGGPGAEAALLVSLAERARRGEREAFRALYERCGSDVQRFLCDLLRDPALAAEGVQEVFSRAFVRLPSLRENERIKAWLLSIARNVHLELCRARGRRRSEEESSPATDPIDPHTPEESLIASEAARLLSRALGGMSDERRAALVLRIDHGLAYEEIARVMGWSLAKAKVEVHRARERLRAELAEAEREVP